MAPQKKSKAQAFAKEHPATPREDRIVPFYGSVTITLDHIAAAKPGVHKQVFSVENSREALNSLVRYYGDSDLFTHASTWDLMAHYQANPEGSIFIYTVPADQAPVHPGHAKSIQETSDRIVQIVVPYKMFLCDLIPAPSIGNGSHMAAVEWLMKHSLQTLAASQQQRGGVPKLQIFQLDTKA